MEKDKYFFGSDSATLRSVFDALVWPCQRGKMRWSPVAPSAVYVRPSLLRGVDKRAICNMGLFHESERAPYKI